MGNAYCGTCNCNDKMEAKNEFKSEIHPNRVPHKFEINSNFPTNNMKNVY